MSASIAKRIHFDKVKEEAPMIAKQVGVPNSSLPNLATILLQTKASEIPFANQAVVELLVGMTPLESAKVLWENKILGAPVWDQDKSCYVGFFDMRDLLSTVLLSEKEGDTWLPSHLTTSYLAARNPFVPLCNLDSSLLQVCEALCQKDAHRVPLVDPHTKRCVRILSQSAIVKFLAQQVTIVEQFPALDQTLNQAKFPYKKPVVQAADTASAREVFTLLEKRRLSGIAIVDEETGKHIGNTSAVDIKLAVRLDAAVAANMDMDILSYLSAVRQEQAHDLYPAAHIAESSTVGHALKLLAKTGFHRFFVVDDQSRCPVGVISVTDMVQFVAAHANPATSL